MTAGVIHIATVPQILTILGTPVTSSQVNVPYVGFTVSAKGGNKPYTYSIQSGTLPVGLSINATTGVVSGTPTIIALASGLVIRVTDCANRTADLASFSINITL